MPAKSKVLASCTRYKQIARELRYVHTYVSRYEEIARQLHTYARILVTSKLLASNTILKFAHLRNARRKHNKPYQVHGSRHCQYIHKLMHESKVTRLTPLLSSPA